MILFILFIINVNSIINSPCSRWYTYFGCEPTIYMIKNIYRNDISSYLSTQLLTHKPEKKINSLINFGIPNNLKEKILNNYISNYQNDLLIFNDSFINIINLSRLKYYSKYLDQFIIKHQPLYFSETFYNQFGFDKGVSESYVENSKIIKITSKGKPYGIHFDIVDNLTYISDIWYNSKYSSKYDSLFNIGKYSNIWSIYNYLYLDKTSIIFSEKEYKQPILINEDKIKVKCNSKESIFNNFLFQNNINIKNINESLLNILIDDRCISLNNIKLIDSHKHKDDFKKEDLYLETYNLIIHPDSQYNVLPSSLYFLLYEKTSELSSINGLPNRINKNQKEIKDNYLKLQINNNEIFTITPNNVFDFSLNPLNTKDIILGADIFKYFSIIKYNKLTNEYEFFIDAITANNDYITLFMSFIVIFLTLLFIRWYKTSHEALSNYIIFNIMIYKNSFYYSNSQAFAEMIAILLGLTTIVLAIYFFIVTSNISIYIIVAFGVLCFLLLILISLSILFIVLTKEKIINLFDITKTLNNNKSEGVIKKIHYFTDEFFYPLVRKYKKPVFLYNNNESLKRDESNYYFSLNNEKVKKRIQQIEKIVDQAILRLYSLTTSEILTQNLLIAISRHLTHSSLIVITMFTALIISIDNKLTKAMLTIISIIFIYHLIYYLLIIIYAYHKFRLQYKKAIWITFIVFYALFVLIIVPYISITFAFNFLDSMNSNHSTVIVALASIILILLVIIMPSKSLSNSIERWSNILENKIELKIENDEIKNIQ